MENLRPNHERAKVAVILIWIMLGMDFVSLVSGYLQYDLLRTAADGGSLSMAAANANDNREQIIAIIYVIAYAISGITFIQWFRRAYFNLHIKVNHLSHGEGWAAGSWFVPILCLYRPFQIMKELYVETKELLVKKGLITNADLDVKYLGWWWALWLLSSLISQFSMRFSLNAETIDQFIVGTVAEMISDSIGIILALITIKVIKDYSTIEPLLNEISDETEKIEAETV